MDGREQRKAKKSKAKQGKAKQSKDERMIDAVPSLARERDAWWLGGFVYASSLGRGGSLVSMDGVLLHPFKSKQSSCCARSSILPPSIPSANRISKTTRHPTYPAPSRHPPSAIRHPSSRHQSMGTSRRRRRGAAVPAAVVGRDVEKRRRRKVCVAAECVLGDGWDGWVRRGVGVGAEAKKTATNKTATHKRKDGRVEGWKCINRMDDGTSREKAGYLG